MTTKDDLIKLARIVAQKQMLLLGLSTANTYGLTHEQRIEQSARYKVAMDEFLIAERIYNEALKTYVPENSLK